MSTTALRNTISLLMVVALFALGAIFGTAILGGNQPAPADAKPPVTDSCPMGLCGSGKSGSIGNIPSPLTDLNTSVGGSGGGLR